MSDDEHVIRNGRFKGKKVEIAPHSGVDRFDDLADQFMREVLDIDTFLITDESNLSDFGPLDERPEQWLSAIHSRIIEVFGVDVSDIRSGNLLEIFIRIHDHSNPSRIN
jgi:hypothetical protein